MSTYRSFRRVPRSDVYQIAEHVKRPTSCELTAADSTAEDWSRPRKSSPVAVLLPTTANWAASIPPKLRPDALCVRFPRIANDLAALWGRPDEAARYLADLFLDKRGGRQGFPLPVLRELHALADHYAILHPSISGRFSFKGDLP